jgi:hypothetical protein
VRDVLYAAYEARPPRFDADVPPELAALATRALDPRAERRYASAEAFRGAVAAFLEHRTSAALADDAMLILGRLRVSVARDRLRQETLDNVRAPVDATLQREVMREFVECRFGFSRALKEWPENERARAGLVEALLLMAEHQLSRGDGTAASATLREIENSTPEEQQLILALEQKAEARRDRQARLEQLGYDQNPKHGRRERALFVLIVSLVLGVFPVGGFVGLHMGWYRYETWHSFAFTGGLCLTLVLGGVLFRQRMMPNRAGRRFVVAMVVLCVLTLLNRVVALALGHTEFRDVAFDVFLFGTGAAMVGTLTDRRFLAPAVAFTLCGLLIALFPSYGMLLIGVATWLGPGWTAWSWLKSSARDAETDDFHRRVNPSEVSGTTRNTRRSRPPLE